MKGAKVLPTRPGTIIGPTHCNNNTGFIYFFYFYQNSRGVLLSMAVKTNLRTQLAENLSNVNLRRVFDKSSLALQIKRGGKLGERCAIDPTLYYSSERP